MEENKNIETNSEAVDKAGFADVNYEESKADKKEADDKKKRCNTRLFGIIIAAVAVLVIILTFAAKTLGGSEVGLTNRFGVVIGIPEGDKLYHSNFAGNKVFETGYGKNNFGESKLVAEVSPWSFTRHNGEIYYFDMVKNGVYKFNKNGDAELIYEGLSYYHQFVGKYIYFVDPSASYGGMVKRVPIKGGEAETVLAVGTSCFAVAENNIIYYDPAINSLLITTIKNGMETAKEANGEMVTSAQIKAVVLAERYATNINVVGKDVYFADAENNNVICHINMKTGELEEMNFGTTGKFLNVYGKYIFYVGDDNALYRMNLDGKDIRNLTGKSFKEFAGFGVFEDRIVAYALMPNLNSETMQTEYDPVIVLMDTDGKALMVVPAIEEGANPLEGMEEAPITEIPEETEEEPAEALS